jgi:hypothetical protein
MNLRPFLFAAVFVPSASFAATGDTCNADTFETTCNDDGTLQRKMREDGRPQDRWVAVHRLVWQAAHGPVPRGSVVVFKPGRFSTELAQITLDAVELISRAELMARNTRHNYSPEINELIGLRAQITRAVNTRAKQEESTP